MLMKNIHMTVNCAKLQQINETVPNLEHFFSRRIKLCVILTTRRETRLRSPTHVID